MYRPDRIGPYHVTDADPIQYRWSNKDGGVFLNRGYEWPDVQYFITAWEPQSFQHFSVRFFTGNLGTPSYENRGQDMFYQQYKPEVPERPGPPVVPAVPAIRHQQDSFWPVIAFLRPLGFEDVDNMMLTLSCAGTFSVDQQFMRPEFLGMNLGNLSELVSRDTEQVAHNTLLLPGANVYDDTYELWSDQAQTTKYYSGGITVSHELTMIHRHPVNKAFKRFVYGPMFRPALGYRFAPGNKVAMRLQFDVTYSVQWYASDLDVWDPNR